MLGVCSQDADNRDEIRFLLPIHFACHSKSATFPCIMMIESGSSGKMT